MAAIQISKAHVGKMHDRVQSLQKRIEKFKDRAEDMTRKFVRTVEVGTAALGVGILQGKTGGVELMGVPAELGAGLALNLLGYFGAAGQHSEHLNNLGDGALAGYLATVGRGLGAEWAGKTVVKSVTASKGDQLSRGEVADIVAQTIAQAAARG